MYRHIFTSSLQRRKSSHSYPYNFIFAVQKKVKVGQSTSRTFRPNMRHTKIKLTDNPELKPNRYCIQTTKFLLQARPNIGSQDSSKRLNIEINMHFIISVPQFQLIIKNKQSKFPFNWKRPKLANALSALRERIAKRIDLFSRRERSPTKLTPKVESRKIKKIQTTFYW